jgi:hypothetical protein
VSIGAPDPDIDILVMTRNVLHSAIGEAFGAECGRILSARDACYSGPRGAFCSQNDVKINFSAFGR